MILAIEKYVIKLANNVRSFSCFIVLYHYSFYSFSRIKLDCYARNYLWHNAVNILHQIYNTLLRTAITINLKFSYLIASRVWLQEVALIWVETESNFCYTFTYKEKWYFKLMPIKKKRPLYILKVEVYLCYNLQRRANWAQSIISIIGSGFQRDLYKHRTTSGKYLLHYYVVHWPI